MNQCISIIFQETPRHNNVLNSIIVNYTLHLCDAAGYLAYKKYHDLQIYTRPTCRGILGDGIRKTKNFKPEIFFSNLQTSKYRRSVFFNHTSVGKVMARVYGWG